MSTGPNCLIQTAESDPAISEFVRFYLERRQQECAEAGSDERKRKRLFDEFTPRLEIALSGLQGTVRRRVKTKVGFCWDDSARYDAELEIIPADKRIVKAPVFERDASTNNLVPAECLETCAVSGTRMLRHTLEKSQESGRYAKSEFMRTCELSGKRALSDELDVSAVTSRHVLKRLLQKSDVSGRLAEPAHLKTCQITGSRCLSDEMAKSEFSGKMFRGDQADRSALTNKLGHQSEFVACHETGQKIARVEAEQCQETRHFVRPGVLSTCEVSGKQVLPAQLKRSAVSGRRAIARLLVESSISGAPMLRDEAIESFKGAYCLPSEAKKCTWSEAIFHPDDIRTCAIAGLPFQSALMTHEGPPRFRLLVELLDGTNPIADDSQTWSDRAKPFEKALTGKCRIESAAVSPTGKHLVACCEVRTMFGLRANQAGGIIDTSSNGIVGRLAVGKRVDGRWAAKAS